MESLSELKREKKKYQALKVNIQNIYNSLNNSRNYLVNANRNIGSCYNIDGESADNGRINKEVNTIDNLNYKLIHLILPQIESKIRVLNSKINNFSE